MQARGPRTTNDEVRAQNSTPTRRSPAVSPPPPPPPPSPAVHRSAIPASPSAPNSVHSASDSAQPERRGAGAPRSQSEARGAPGLSGANRPLAVPVASDRAIDERSHRQLSGRPPGTGGEWAIDARSHRQLPTGARGGARSGSWCALRAHAVTILHRNRRRTAIRSSYRQTGGQPTLHPPPVHVPVEQAPPAPPPLLPPTKAVADMASVAPSRPHDGQSGPVARSLMRRMASNRRPHS
jgi:hypothetical protein